MLYLDGKSAMAIDQFHVQVFAVRYKRVVHYYNAVTHDIIENMVLNDGVYCMCLKSNRKELLFLVSLTMLILV